MFATLSTFLPHAIALLVGLFLGWVAHIVKVSQTAPDEVELLMEDGLAFLTRMSKVLTPDPVVAQKAAMKAQADAVRLASLNQALASLVKPTT